MSLVASSISGAAYVMASGEDKDNGNGFEPAPENSTTAASSDGKNAQLWGWKVIYASPSIGDMLGQKPNDVEGRDFFDLVYAPDQAQLQGVFQNLLAPSLSHRTSSTSTSTNSTMPNTPLHQPTSSKSQTTYIRMLTESQSRPSSAGKFANAAPSASPRTVIWEVRAHATGAESSDAPPAFGLGNAGTMVPQTGGDSENGMKGKAVWVMGRRISDGSAEGDGNPQSLDAFLELKLENEKLRSELRDLRGDFDDDELSSRPSFVDPSPSRPAQYAQSDSEASSSFSPSSSAASSPAYTQPARPKVGRPPKDKDGREKKRAKKTSAVQSNARASNNAAEGEGMHVCVTCGRTDSPEWRKGPLGPKTLCNACGLRWAKRNSTAPTRKEKKSAAVKA